jgi:hypothetical protein
LTIESAYYNLGSGKVEFTWFNFYSK